MGYVSKRVLSLLLAFLLLFLSSCSQTGTKNANGIARLVGLQKELLVSCVKEMEALGQDRIYVAIETRKEKEGEVLAEAEKAPRLVSYVKESDERQELKNPVLKEVIETFGLALIFFQTASDARRCVIFSYTKENHEGVQNGFYYSYDGSPCAWWGRRAKLIRQNDRHIQLSRDGKAAYYTIPIDSSFYYFEKYGALGA